MGIFRNQPAAIDVTDVAGLAAAVADIARPYDARIADIERQYHADVDRRRASGEPEDSFAQSKADTAIARVRADKRAAQRRWFTSIESGAWSHREVLYADARAPLEKTVEAMERLRQYELGVNAIARQCDAVTLPLVADRTVTPDLLWNFEAIGQTRLKKPEPQKAPPTPTEFSIA